MLSSRISGLSEPSIWMGTRRQGLLGGHSAPVLGDSGKASGFRLRIPEILAPGPQEDSHALGLISPVYASHASYTEYVLPWPCCAHWSHRMFPSAFNVHPEKNKFMTISQLQSFSEPMNKIFLNNKLTHRERNKKGCQQKGAHQ